MNKLTDDQLQTFDQDYMSIERWRALKNCIYNSFPDREFNFLDIGGGNGVFSDRILAEFPKANGIVFDNSELLLSKNTSDYRKDIIFGDIKDEQIIIGKKVDIIFFNWVLHHLIDTNYKKTKNNIFNTINKVKPLLTQKGIISIYENMYNGLIFDQLPSKIIYQLTYSKLLSKATKKLGANTAGIGVCFLSYNQWCDIIGKSDLEILKIYKDIDWEFGLSWKLLLHTGSAYCAHFWLSR